MHLRIVMTDRSDETGKARLIKFIIQRMRAYFHHQEFFATPPPAGGLQVTPWPGHSSLPDRSVNSNLARV